MPAHPLSLREGQRAPGAHRLGLTDSQIPPAAGSLGRALHPRSRLRRPMIAPGPTLGACSNAEIVDEFRERINISFLGHRAEHPRGNSGLVLRRFWTMHALETRSSSLELTAWGAMPLR